MAEYEENGDRAHGILSALSVEPDKIEAGEGAAMGLGRELKTKKYLQEQFDRTMSFKEWSSAEHFAILLVLLMYFSTGLEGAISKYRDVYESLTTREMLKSATHERILLGISRILFQHTRVEGWYRASTLRDFWADAIHAFPHNTAFLSLFAWNESNARIDGRVRKLRGELEKEAKVDTWIFGIWTEVSLERGRVSEFSVRPVFEKAVEAMYGSPSRVPICRVFGPFCDCLSRCGILIRGRKLSVVLWMLFIEFEARYGKPVLAKVLVLRAIRECPWSKGNLSHSPLIRVSELS
jgi:hypothetical protein